MNLPACSHRGRKIGDQYKCASDRLLHGGAVPPAICMRCPYANKPNIGTQIDAQPLPGEYVKPCIHRSQEPIGKARCKPCQSAGRRALPLYHCDLFGEGCITNGYSVGVDHVCIKCPEALPPK